MRAIIFLLLFSFAIFPFCAENNESIAEPVTDQEADKEPLTQKSASISGKVTDEKTGVGVPGVVVRIGNRKLLSDENGFFTFMDIEPDKGCSITFYPPPPYCPRSEVSTYILEGENIVNLTLGHLGSIMGRVYKSQGVPFSNAEVLIKRRGFRKSFSTKVDGSFAMEGLCPCQDLLDFSEYYILVSHKIPGLSFRYRKGIKIKSGECTHIKDIFFDTAEDTGISGYVTSSLDGGPLPGVKVLLRFYLYGTTHQGFLQYGSIRTDSEGYFCLRNIEPPGLYFIETWLPRCPYPKNHNTGEDLYTVKDYGRNQKKIKVKVRKGVLSRLSISLDVPSYTGYWPD